MSSVAPSGEFVAAEAKAVTVVAGKAGKAVCKCRGSSKW